MGSGLVLSSAEYYQRTRRRPCNCGRLFPACIARHKAERSADPARWYSWTHCELDRGSCGQRRLTCIESNIEYQEFLAASTKVNDGADSNLNQRIRVDVRGTSDAAPQKRGVKAGRKQNSQALGSLDSLINSGGVAAFACPASCARDMRPDARARFDPNRTAGE